MKKTKNGVLLVGKASEEVTGSMYLVTFNNHQMLLECGLHQTAKDNLLEAYRINTAKFPFDVKKVQWVWINHPHIDHSGLIPRLYAEGCRARIITTRANAKIIALLWYNSAYIMNKEAIRLSKQTGRVYKPVYTKEDVDLALSFIDYYDDMDKVFALDKDVKFQWLKNGHCLGATQLQLILGTNGDTKKIMYTSDLGAIKPVNHFVSETEIPDFYNDIVIMETTYGDPKRKIKKKRSFEIEKMKSIINTTIDQHGTVVFPAFAFAKMQEILISLYESYGNDPEFKTQVYVDTMLGVDICKAYLNILEGEDKEQWKRVLSWSNLHLIREYEESEVLLRDDHSKIIVSASGFATNGRVVNHIKKVVKDSKNAIVITGYPGAIDAYLARRLITNKTKNKITIDGVEYPYRACLYELDTFSSHMDYNGLLTYGGKTRTNNLVLVHGDMEGKLKLKPNLIEERSKNNLNGNVIIGKQGMFIEL